jgi:hypothetical protein
MGRLLLAAIVLGGGLFAGIRLSDRAQALLPPRGHVVELVPPEAVRQPRQPKTATHAHRGVRRASTNEDAESE